MIVAISHKKLMLPLSQLVCKIPQAFVLAGLFAIQIVAYALIHKGRISFLLNFVHCSK